NHGEDVKELYYYLDSSPTHSYMKGLYKYPQLEFPYGQLVTENARRGRQDPEFELLDTGIFDDNRYFDVTVEYAKNTPDDILIRITVANRGSETARVHLLPTLWFRNCWSWGAVHEGCATRPALVRESPTRVRAAHPTLSTFVCEFEPVAGAPAPALLFTENDTNVHRLFGAENPPFVKDGINEFVVHGRHDAVNPAGAGTKVVAHYALDVPAAREAVVRVRLRPQQDAVGNPFGEEFERIFKRCKSECDEYYQSVLIDGMTDEEQQIARQAFAGMLWSKQFYHYIVPDWLSGDPAQPAPPPQRKKGRNHDWTQLYSRDVLSMPDNWEYPWFAAWDLAFHMIPLAQIDGQFAKDQMLLLLREWYMHPNGQIPAYEFAFSDVNPPVHAWAAWRVYKITGRKGERDKLFLARCFQKLMLNFTWWVNRKDVTGKNIFGGGFLGLDNIGIFDRSKPLPGGGVLEQADGTAWMAFYCGTMLSMALELALDDPSYEDIASKFFEHFVAIVDAINTVGGTGLWNEQDGFYYDQLQLGGQTTPLRIRSMVGLIPLFACEILDQEHIDRLPGFAKRMRWFLENRKDLARHISFMARGCDGDEDANQRHYLLAIPSRDRLQRVLRYLLDESEFLAPYGVRSLSRVHKD
ncbi:MAG: MGH1-like glycoside hydrolase domain-containing protein, partial [Tepidisphaeraceae bacterium]